MKTFILTILLSLSLISFSQNEKTLQFVSITNNIDTCENLPVMLVVEFLDYDSLHWMWNDGSGYTSLIEGATFSGTHNDTLYFTTDMSFDNTTFRCQAYNFTDGTTDISTVASIHIENDYPHADYYEKDVCFGDSVSINAYCFAGISSCTWSTGQNTTYIYVSPLDTTTYYFTAVGGNGCISSDSTIVNVINPSSNFEISEDTICQYTELQISAEYDEFTAYYYNIFKTDSFYNSWQNFSIELNSYGTDTLFFYIKDNGCYSDTSYKILTVLNNEVLITQSNDTLFASSGQSFQWYYNDSILINETDSFIVVDSIGIYKVEVLNYLGCSHFDMYYYSPPVSIITAEPNPICVGDTANLIANTTICKLFDFNNFELDSNFTGSGTFNFTNPCLSSSDLSPYLWIGDNVCFPRDLTTVPMDLSDDFEICFDFAMAIQGDNPLCEGPDEMDEGVSLQYSIDNGLTWVDVTYFCPDGNQYSYNQWVGQSTAGGGTGTPFNEWANYCFNISTTSSNNKMIRWYQDQITDVGYDHWGLDNIKICDINDTTISVNWYQDAVFISNEDTVQVSPNQTTVYNVYLYNSITPADSAQVEVVVNPLPEPPIYTDTSNIISTDVYEQYQWYLNNNSIFGATNIDYEIDTSAYYSVQVVDSNGCVGNSDTIFVAISSISEINDNYLIKIYPNPVKDFLIIENEELIISNIQIFNLSGKVLISKQNNSNKVNIDASKLEKGIYFVKINEFESAIRFIKQ